jgi:hypothetical protein
LAIVNVRIPDELKRRMEEFPQLNWSEIIRQAVESKIILEKRSEKDRQRLMSALKSQDRIAEKLGEHYKGSWKGTEVVRYWREHRYSSLTRR